VTLDVVVSAVPLIRICPPELIANVVPCESVICGPTVVTVVLLALSVMVSGAVVVPAVGCHASVDMVLNRHRPAPVSYQTAWLT
jgi:hypothetical protein